MPSVPEIARSLLAADPVDRAMFPTERNGTINWVGRNSVLSRMFNPVEAGRAVIRETFRPNDPAQFDGVTGSAGGRGRVGNNPTAFTGASGSVVGRGRVGGNSAPWASRPLGGGRPPIDSPRGNSAGMAVQQRSNFLTREAERISAEAAARRNGPIPLMMPQGGGRAGDTPQAQHQRDMLGIGMQSDASSINRMMQELESFRQRGGFELER